MEKSADSAFDPNAVTTAQWLHFSWYLFADSLVEFDQWEGDSGDFDGLTTSEYNRRVAYVLAMSGILNSLGLHNQYEPESLFIEPFHCYSADEEEEALATACGDIPVASLKEMGLSVLSPELVSRYLMLRSTEVGAGHSVASLLESIHASDGTPVLFDPLYGMALVRVTGGWRTLCFATALWRDLAMRLPPALAIAHLAEPQSSLSQGVLAARLLFLDVLPDEERTAVLGFRVPEIAVATPAELYRWMDRLQERVDATNNGFRLWYRGQTADYLVPDRARLVDSSIAPYCNVRDSGLVPSIYRSIDRYTHDQSGFVRLVRHVGDWATNAQLLLPEIATILDENGEHAYSPLARPGGARSRVSMYAAGRPHLDLPGLRDLGPYSRFEILDEEGQVVESYLKLHHPSLQGHRVMLLLQHYGCPTPSIDVTHDRDVALWFALNGLASHSPGRLRATRIAAPLGAPVESWPVVYVFALHPRHHPIVDTSDILAGSEFVRPQVQKCGLLGGAGNLARNYGARFIALKFRLGPGFTGVRLPAAEHYFPPPGQDRGLARLLASEAQWPSDRLYPVYTVVS